MEAGAAATTLTADCGSLEATQKEDAATKGRAMQRGARCEIGDEGCVKGYLQRSAEKSAKQLLPEPHAAPFDLCASCAILQKLVLRGQRLEQLPAIVRGRVV